MTSSQGNNAFSAPVVSGSPFSTQLGSYVPNIAIGCDFNSKTDYADIVISFTTAVKNVTFNVADIDKNWGTDDYFDEIVVTGTNSGMAVTNPTITKLVSSSNFVTIASNVATANTSFWPGGNSASNPFDQDGTVVINFGSTILTAVTIRYRNNSASQNNPADQSIAIVNISFQRAAVLPLTLTAFNGAVTNNSVKLNWTTAQEENLDAFIVEKSSNASDWQMLTTVKATGNSNSPKEYNTIDQNAAPVTYYRLKEVDMDGHYKYSQIIRIRNGAVDQTGIKIYPNPAINSTMVSINSESKQAAHIKLYNQFGMQLLHLKRPLIAGSNNIPIPGISALLTGSYLLCVEDEAGNKIGTTQFIKK
jgi:hypothetical protein